MNYGSVIFDMDGVILDFAGDNFEWKYAAVREALGELGVDPEDMSRDELDAFLGDKGFEGCVERCENLGINPERTWRIVAEKTTEARKRKIEEGVFSLYDGSRAVLDELRSIEVELGLISNAPEDAVRLTMEHFNLKQYFKFFRGVESFKDMRKGKPRPDHLEIAEAELQKPPYLFVGDASSDIAAAENAGMDSAWVDRKDASIDSDPDYTVESLDELLELVGRR